METREGQRAIWAAGDYRTVGAQFLLASELLTEALDLRANERLLDVATGTGNLALAAARRAAAVTALDLVPDLLGHARRRADAEGLAVAFHEGDAEDLPFPDSSFDVVTSAFGVMFARNQERAAAELMRVCRPGGRIGLATWTPDSYMGRMLELNTRYVPVPEGTHPPTRWGTREGLTELFGSGTGIHATPRTLRWRFPSPAEHAQVWAEVYGPTATAMDALGEEGRAALVGDLLALAEELNADTTGALLLPLDYLEVVVSL
ncbi:class I SAM-dependent methyltransferase [Planomonospora venezuelensis]|uniref:SAM-dependent methyltransferase n=1 Tax=Planomonospora venezuelensis TaxID=1999 RepID=A0A841DKU9_PLAVE|nr:class I SAM-dependent methyltransferase [Planomonospora venezuelensis]MBB5967736.1 SAM-dependent methyltransferase [Planomonospora venezuelensis]GIN03734.1 hypothetical protein Pve01_53920 [Planomonospora venezuelensis]